MEGQKICDNLVLMKNAQLCYSWLKKSKVSDV